MGNLNDKIKYQEDQIADCMCQIRKANDEWMARKSTDDEKEQYLDFVHGLWDFVTTRKAELEEYKTKRNDLGRFPANKIGPLIARIMSEVEGKKFSYLEVSYFDIPDVYDIYEDFEPGVSGHICFVTNKPQIANTTLNRRETFSMISDEKTICLATIGFDLPGYIYKRCSYEVQQINSGDDSIAFYNPEYDVLVKEFTYIYEFIDMLIDRQNEMSQSLKEEDYEEIANNIISKYKKEKALTLKRLDKQNG